VDLFERFAILETEDVIIWFAYCLNFECPIISGIIGGIVTIAVASKKNERLGLRIALGILGFCVGGAFGFFVLNLVWMLLGGTIVFF